MIDKVLDRSQPHDLESEKWILGSVMLNRNAADTAGEMLLPADFFDEMHQIIFETAMSLNNSGKSAQLNIMMTELRKLKGHKKKLFNGCGGASFLAKIYDRAPVATHIKYYAEQVRAKSILRQLQQAGITIAESTMSPDAEADEVLSAAEQTIFSVAERGTLSNMETLTAKEVIAQALDRIDLRMESGRGDGIMTGIDELDKKTGGMRAGELLIIAARPTQGKTSLGLNIAEHAAIKGGNAVLIVSLEMDKLEVADRMLGSLARVDLSRMRNGTMSRQDRAAVVAASGPISASPLFVDDSPGRNMTGIASVARRLKRKHGLDLLIIDYLQLIQPDNPRDPRQEQVSKISRRLKLLARDLQIPVLCLSQLNRTADTPGTPPRLSMLRESGAIEQDADVVIFIHRPAMYDKDKQVRRGEAEEAELHLSKQRNGPTGVIKVHWFREFARFDNAANSRWEESRYDFFEQWSKDD